MSENINQILQKNLLKMNQKYPQYAEEFQDMHINSEKYILESTRENAKTLKVLKENKYFYIHSKYYPIKEAVEWVDNNVNLLDKINVFFGFGNGYYIMDLLSKMPVDSKVFIFEPDIDIFKIAMKNIDLENVIMSENILIALGDIEIFKRYIISIDYNDANKLSIYSLPNYSVLFCEELENLCRVIEDFTVAKSMDKNTINFFSQTWQFNFLKNLKYLFDSCLFAEFENKFKDIPVIIVAAGPSLDKNVSLLKNVKGHAIIMCVGRALKVLLKNGIKPDIVAALDGSELSIMQFDGLDYSDIALLYGPSVCPKILERHNGRKILFTNFNYHLETVLKQMGVKYNEVPCGGSVATMIFSFARLTGANPIIFVGQDLAFKGNETHASGTYYGNNIDVDITKRRLKKVTGINGEELLTSYDLYTFLRWFELHIAYVKTGQIFINATEGGANIQGTVVKTLSSVIEEYCENAKEVKPIMNNVFEFRKKYSNKLIRKYINELSSTLENMDEVIGICKKAYKSNEELFKIYKFNLGKNVKPIVSRLEKCDEFLKSKKNEFALLDYIMQPVYDNVLSKKALQGDSSEKERALDIVETGRGFYKGIEELTLKTKPLISELIYELKRKYPESEGGMEE